MYWQNQNFDKLKNTYNNIINNDTQKLYTYKVK